MIHLPGVLAAAGEVQRFCEERRWPFCFIGGIAVQRWGEPRLTQDVDLTLLTGFGREETFIDEMLKRFSGRRADARDFALKYRVILAKTTNEIPIDVAMGAFPFEERSVQRATQWEWSEGNSLLTCSAEDLITHKVFAGRDRDWDDIERILTRQGTKLNLSQINTELKPLLEVKGASDAMRKFNEIQRRVERRLGRNP